MTNTGLWDGMKRLVGAWVTVLVVSISGLACPHKKAGEPRGGRDARRDETTRTQGKGSDETAKGRYVVASPARFYNGNDGEKDEIALGVVEERVYQMVARQTAAQRRPELERSGRLAKVASDLVRLPREAHASDKVLAFLTASRGLLEPVPLVLTISAKDSSGAAALNLLDKRLPALLKARPFTRVGVAFARSQGETYRLVLALQESHITTVPVPRQGKCGGKISFGGWVVGAFRKPTLVVTLPDGKTRQRNISMARDGKFKVELALDRGKGRYQVEILANGKVGPTVLANFPVYCGRAPPKSVRIPRNKGASRSTKRTPPKREVVEKRLFAWLNRDRKRAGRRPMKRVETLVLVARSHSQEMCRTGRFGHLSPTTGSADDRLREAGYRPRIVGENVAQATTVEGVHSALMGSPSHRANILSAKLTHVGIGVVVCPVEDGSFQLYVTQLFIKP